MQQTSLAPIIVQPDGGHLLHAYGNAMQVLLSGEQTANTLALMIETTPPGGGPPPHVHANEDELFLVIEGQIEYWANGAWTPVGPGGAVYLPRGAAHTYRNTGAAPSRHWILTTPAGFERFFTASAALFTAPEPPTQAQIVDTHNAHGIILLAAT
jgi:quercetin dioxygenase-like cupin family protein